ncbi:hypothetical protein CR513_18002, partial [Mucuna pruriens]
MKSMPKLWSKMKKIIFLLQHVFLQGGNSECWLIDSGCTNHMTYDKSQFKDLKSTNVSKVKIGNGGHIFVEGKGTIAISTSLGTKIILYVLYVPKIDQNLLSVGQLIETKFKVYCEHQHCLIYNIVGREFLKVKIRDKNFSFNLTQKEQATYYTQVSPTELWHKRLGHCHLERMLNMKKKDMSKVYQYFQIICQIVMLVNLLIHTDVARPQRTPSLQDQQWDWKNSQKIIESFHNIRDSYPKEQTKELLHNELKDKPPIKSKRLLSNIYQKCNVAIC